jgi:hypothetical protein
MNKELVRITLTKLLEVPINDPMPNGSGVCLELGMVALLEAGVNISNVHRWRQIELAEDTQEYEWCYDHCLDIHGMSMCDNYLGTMTEKRKQFVRTLLGELTNDK